MMSLIEEWRWERNDENPLQPFEDSFLNYLIKKIKEQCEEELQMNEKRFWFVIDKGKLDYVQDNVSKEKITVSELEDLLNEQQEKITELEKENGILRKIIKMAC